MKWWYFWRSKPANLMDALVDNLLEGMIDTGDKPKVQKSSCGSGSGAGSPS